MIETLRTLAGAFAVSGCEQDMARCVLELAASYGTCGRDAMGNVILHRAGNRGKGDAGSAPGYSGTHCH